MAGRICPSRSATAGAGAVRRRRRGFSLVESLVAVSILGAAVLAVSVAITTAQQVAFEGQKRMLAAIAADDMLSELATLEYRDRPDWDGVLQEVGALQTIDGEAYPEAYWAVGRQVTVTEVVIDDDGLGIPIRGQEIVVTIIDSMGVIGTVEAFMPEPSS